MIDASWIHNISYDTNGNFCGPSSGALHHSSRGHGWLHWEEAHWCVLMSHSWKYGPDKDRSFLRHSFSVVNLESVFSGWRQVKRRRGFLFGFEEKVNISGVAMSSLSKHIQTQTNKHTHTHTGLKVFLLSSSEPGPSAQPICLTQPETKHGFWCQRQQPNDDYFKMLVAKSCFSAGITLKTHRISGLNGIKQQCTHVRGSGKLKKKKYFSFA